MRLATDGSGRRHGEIPDRTESRVEMAAGLRDGHRPGGIYRNRAPANQGSTITRHGTPENPAYLLLTKKSVEVLKLESELYDGEKMPGAKAAE